MATLLDALDAAVNHHMAGRLGDAERLYRLVLSVAPEQADALHLHGVLQAQRGTPEAAVALIGRSLLIRPLAAAPQAHLGGALRSLGRLDEARRTLVRALVLDPAQADATDTLGGVEHALNRYEAAQVWLSRALALRPGQLATMTNLGTVLRDQRRFAEAESLLSATLDRAGQRPPVGTDAGLALAVSRLIQGDLREGWRLFDHWRWKRFPTPPWLGEPLQGRTILLHAEQGFGDTIQFVRYAPLVAQAGGRVLLELPSPLLRLLGGLARPGGGPDGGIELVARGAEPPPHDRHCPLMSLPRAFATDLSGIPGAAGYLAAGTAEAFRPLPGGTQADGLRVGLVWAGNPRHRNDHNRSIPPQRLRPLLEVPGVRFFSLQAGDARAALPRLPSAMTGAVTDAMEGVGDFADTAALLAQLDLLVAVDTATVHLAGALGVPAWLLLPYAPDWRWLLDRPDSPWYASLRLFRQPRPGDWDGALATVAAELRTLVSARSEGRPGTRF